MSNISNQNSKMEKSQLISIVKCIKCRESKTPGVGRFKANAYSSTLDELNKLPGRTVNMAIIKKMKQTPHMKDKLMMIVAKKIQCKITAYEQLISVPGIGSKKAKELMAQGVTVKQLSQKKYNNDLSKATKIWVKYRPTSPIPRSTITSLRKFITSGRDQIVGSYRRGNSQSSDIDILTTDTICKYLKKLTLPIVVISKGRDKASFLVEYKKAWYKTDVFYVKDNFAAMLLYTTGSKATNIHMRAKAKHLGYLLNRKGLYKISTGAIVETKTEKEIFRLLNIPYIKPTER
jgi:DNA polymerase/3'-5' exonuclease PolX